MAKKSRNTAKPQAEKVEVGKSGFSFPGFKEDENGFSVTTTHFVARGILVVAGEETRLEFILARKAAEFGSYLLASLYKRVGGAWTKAWTFKEENFGGLGFLAMACGEPVIVFVSDGKATKILPLADIVSAAPPRHPVETARLKHEATMWLRRRGQPKLGTSYTLAEDDADKKFRENLVRKMEVGRNIRKFAGCRMRKSA
jgi:hypothetical protein